MLELEYQYSRITIQEVKHKESAGCGSLSALWINVYTFLIGVARSSYSVLYNLFLRSQGFDNVVVGRATFYYSWGLAFGGLFFSSLSDRIGRKNTIILTIPLFSLLGFLRLLANTPILIVMLSLLFGFFDTSIILPTISVIESSDDRKRLRNSNINFAIVMLTGVLGYFGAGLLAPWLGYFRSLTLSMLFALASVIPVLLLPNLKRASRLERILELNLGQIVMLAYYTVSGALVSFAAGIFINFGNVIFYDIFSFSPTAISAILAVSQLSTAATSLFSHKLTEKVGYKLSLFSLYGAVTLLIYTLPILMSNSIAFSFGYILRFVLLNISTPMYMVFCLTYLPRNYVATFSGLSYFINNTMRAYSAYTFSKLSVSGWTDYSQLFLTTGHYYLLNTVATLATFAMLTLLSSKGLDKKVLIKLEQKGDFSGRKYLGSSGHVVGRLHSFRTAKKRVSKRHSGVHIHHRY